MATPIKSLAALERAIQQPEHEHLEFKEARRNYSTEKLLNYCVALANEGGGQLVLGVSDKPPRQVVGSAAFGNLEATKKLVFDALHFRVDVTQLNHPLGRVLVFRVPGRSIGTPVHIEGRYLSRVGDSLVPMTPDQLRTIFSESMASAPKDHGYLCGSRLRRVRTDLRLKPSHLVELIRFPGEALWNKAERNEAEVADMYLSELALLTGARLDWLKHEDGEVYEQWEVWDYSWREDLAPIQGANSLDLKVAIAPDTMQCAVLHERNPLRVDVYRFTFDLGFWHWADDHGHIPRIWECLRWLHSEVEVRGGLIVCKALADDLFLGNLHARTALDELSARSHWFDDLFDLDHGHKHLQTEYGAYGPWFLKLQEAIKRWGIPKSSSH